MSDTCMGQDLMDESQVTTKRGPKTKSGLTAKQISAASAEVDRTNGKRSASISDRGLEWGNHTKVVARAAGVTPRSVEIWRHKEPYMAEVIRLLFLRPQNARKTPPPPPKMMLTEQEVERLFMEGSGPVRSPVNGMLYYDWKPYWDHLEASKLSVLRPKQ